MRMTSLVAGLAVIVAACGGEKKAEEQPAAGPAAGAPEQSAPAAAPAATGKAHDVNMTLDGSKYKFDPDNLTIKSGEVVRYHNKSGGPHNVS
ncbi:MAG: plastocyanin/azurin family copper-binding protein, partial [Gemmatimonadales bacterium]